MGLKARFEVKESMGEGGFARVFHASERATGREVALKVLKSAFIANSEVVERFQREVFAVASVSNPHIVSMYDFGFTEDECFIAMELVEGRTLRELMAERHWSVDEIYSIVRQICDALSCAHRQNVVHRDLKPENLKLVPREDGSWHVKILDFGMAKLVDLERKLELQPLTRAGVCFGTPQYMAPEQIRGQVTDGGVDLFALGVIAYELISGGRPWDGNDPYDVMRAVLGTQPPVLTRTRAAETQLAELNRFFRRALAKSRAERPADAEAFLADFGRAVFGDAQVPATERTEAPRVEPRADATVQMDVQRADDTSENDAPPAFNSGEPTLTGAGPEASAVAEAVQSVVKTIPTPTPDFSRRSHSYPTVTRRRSAFASWVLPLACLILLGGTVGYLMGAAPSAQANEIHDWLVKGSTRPR